MFEGPIIILRWMVKAGVWMAMAAAMLIFISTVVGKIAQPISNSLLTDIFAMVQVWAPFNIGPIVAWLLTAISFYITYKLAAIIYDSINNFLK